MKLLCTNVDKSLYLWGKVNKLFEKVKNGDPDMFWHDCRVPESKINQKHILKLALIINISLFDFDNYNKVKILTKSIQEKFNWELHFNYRKLISLPQTAGYQNPVTFHVK